MRKPVIIAHGLTARLSRNRARKYRPCGDGAAWSARGIAEGDGYGTAGRHTATRGRLEADGRQSSRRLAELQLAVLIGRIDSGPWWRPRGLRFCGREATYWKSRISDSFFLIAERNTSTRSNTSSKDSWPPKVDARVPGLSFYLSGQAMARGKSGSNENSQHADVVRMLA